MGFPCGGQFARRAEDYLKHWHGTPHRKPLALRGARQVGKSTLVNEGPLAEQFIGQHVAYRARSAQISREVTFELLSLPLYAVEALPLAAGGEIDGEAKVP